jgi:NAD(P)-dependent dehydrogenase (short-subunit alcohol dehydrogenase family)
MSLPWILVCPSSRGIGFALTRKLLLTTSLPVLATTRQRDPSVTKSALLEGLVGNNNNSNNNNPSRRLTVVPCDVTDESSIAAAAAEAARLFPPREHHLQLACAIPGVLHPEKSPRQVDAALALDSLRVNTLGPLLLMKHFGDLLPRRRTEMAEEWPSPSESKAGTGTTGAISSRAGATAAAAAAVWLNMAARVGSTADNRLGGWYSYRASKAAVISLTKTFDLHLAARCGDRAMAVAYHPGTVRTDFSEAFWAGVEEGKLFSPEYAVDRMLDVVAGLRLEQRGRCWDWKNEQVPP